MKTPKTPNEKPKVKTMNASLKGAGKAISRAKINNSGPAIAKAEIEQQRDGSWIAALKCLNGDPRRNLETVIPAGTPFANGLRLPAKGEVAVVLPDGRSIDTNAIFPWTTDPSTARGGGVGKGQTHEGAQDPGRTGPPVPISWPAIETSWINGAIVKTTIRANDTMGQVFFPGDEAFFYYIVDDKGDEVVKLLVHAEGDCLNIGVDRIITGNPGPDPTK